MTLAIDNCPTSASPGDSLALTGTYNAGDELPTGDVTFNGGDVDSTMQTDGANLQFTLSFKVPACAPPPEANIITVTVSQGGKTSAPCTFQVTC